MSREIELKLAIDPRDVQTLRASSILRELAMKRTPRRSLVSVYYDTPSRSLAWKGIMLRVRKIGSKRVQCVKMKAAATSVFQRTEFESPIRGNRPDLTQIEMSAGRFRRVVPTMTSHVFLRRMLNAKPGFCGSDEARSNAQSIAA